MTHKQSKLTRRQECKYSTTKVSNVEPRYEERPRRTLLLSSEDVDRMALESSRARVMMQLVSKPVETSREFGSYFRGLKNESDPVYVMTSHTSAIPIPKRIVPAYPSMVQDIKWSPTIEQNTTHSEDSQTDNGEDDSNFTCRCRKCKKKNCLAKGNTEIQNCFRDNIVKFSDNCTMTPKLEDIGCGSRTPLSPTTPTSEVSITTSESLGLEHNVSPRYRAAPIPILKKPRASVTVHEPVRDSNKLKDSKRIWKSSKIRDEIPLCPNNSDDTSDCEYGRKIIYNEGISDLLKNAVSRRPTPTRSPARRQSPSRRQSNSRLKRNVSKASIMNKGLDKETTIPYAHREHSRYHSDCKQSITKSYRCEIAQYNLHRVESPPEVRRTLTSKEIRYSRNPSIRLPKKVLTSERDIEAFVDKRKQKTVCPSFI